MTGYAESDESRRLNAITEEMMQKQRREAEVTALARDLFVRAVTTPGATSNETGDSPKTSTLRTIVATFQAAEWFVAYAESRGKEKP